MANTTYAYTLPNLTLATRRKAYERLSTLFSHMIALNVDLVSLTRTGLNVSLTVTNPIPADHLSHVGCNLDDD